MTLLWQGRRHARREADGSISLPLTQKDLAHLAGASREAVADQIAAFKLAGLLLTGYRSIKPTDPRGLMQTLTTEFEFDFPELINRESIAS